jgi:hypothetical protein
MSTKEKLEGLVSDLKDWQKVENAAVAQTGKIMERTENPLINTVMEIIQRDSHMHHRVQQLIIDSTENDVVHVSVDDLVKVWDAIEKHIEIEKKTVSLALKALDAIKGAKYPLHKYLITYLLEDEKKHDKLLEDLKLIKGDMYPY